MKFKYQKERKAASKEKILKVLALMKGETFTRLHKLTGLSKPVLSDRLEDLEKEGKITRVLDKESGRALYQLTKGALSLGHIQRAVFSTLSTCILNDLFDAAGKLTDNEFLKRFSQKVGALEIYTLLIGLSIGKDDPDEGGKWIEEASGTLIQKYSMRRCLFRQFFGGLYELKHLIKLKEPVRPEFEIEEHEGKGEILVRLPEAFETGLTSKIMRELPDMPETRLMELKSALGGLYPEEIKTLDELLSEIGISIDGGEKGHEKGGA